MHIWEKTDLHYAFRAGVRTRIWKTHTASTFFQKTPGIFYVFLSGNVCFSYRKHRNRKCNERLSHRHFLNTKGLKGEKTERLKGKNGTPEGKKRNTWKTNATLTRKNRQANTKKTKETAYKKRSEKPANKKRVRNPKKVTLRTDIKKRSSAELQPLLTLNLILWKTQCKSKHST